MPGAHDNVNPVNHTSRTLPDSRLNLYQHPLQAHTSPHQHSQIRLRGNSYAGGQPHRQLNPRRQEELPERQSHLTRSERELLTIVNDASGLRFIDLCGLHHAKFNDDFINWLEIPVFLDELEIKGLIEYGNRPGHSNQIEIVEQNIHDDFYAYHNVEIRITDKGRNAISGSPTAFQNTSESEISTLSENETPWLWDENEMRVVRAFHPADK